MTQYFYSQVETNLGKTGMFTLGPSDDLYSLSNELNTNYLTKSQIGEWQQILKERGFYKTSVDSVFGPATRQATLDNFNPEKALESQQFLKAKRDSIENIIQDKWIEEEARKILIEKGGIEIEGELTLCNTDYEQAQLVGILE